MDEDLQLSLLQGLQGQAQDAVDLFDPTRLTQARQALGWTKRALAATVEVTPTAIGYLEAGVTRPRPTLLARLAEALEVTPAFFVAGRPRAAAEAANTHFRSLRSMRVYERDQAVTFAAQCWELAHALEEHVHLPGLSLPQPPFEDLPDTGPTPAAGVNLARTAGLARALTAARAVRRSWQLTDRPVAHLVRLLESHGVIVALLPFNDARRVDAFSTAATPRPVIVLTSETGNVYRHRFTAAHELGHLLLHPDAAPGDTRHEREADAFAAELLMPANQLLHDLPPRLDLPRLVTLQSTWGVSVEALLYRGRELSIYSEATHRRGRIKINDLRSRGLLAPAAVRDYPGEQPALLRTAFNTAADYGGLTVTNLARDLAWQPRRLHQMLGLDLEDDRPVLRLV
jgi:Zn-dependent peptidase ImmA (M78 family)/transcriptional regulator with XRE-family HTH domain